MASPPSNNSNRARTVHSTWNESRNNEFPQVLEYRKKWEELGFTVQVTPNSHIRNDIELLDSLLPSLNVLHMFDSLATTNMKFDVWRYTKLYLEGGVYADVDVEPLPGIQQYVRQSTTKPVLFEESNWPSNILTRMIIPLVSDYTELPAYGTCVVVSPEPHSEFFLELLRDMRPDDWIDVKEPRRTLMSVGPGYVTQFVKEHANEAVLVPHQERMKVYIHHGFGTWKSWARKEARVAGVLSLLAVILMCLFRKRIILRAKYLTAVVEKKCYNNNKHATVCGAEKGRGGGILVSDWRGNAHSRYES